MSASQLIVQRRKAAGLSQERLAYKAGLSLSTIRRVEVAIIRPEATTLASIGKALGITPDEMNDALMGTTT